MRLNLMEKKKTKRYILYAIGEIVLVVIGILIALQINNWNEERKEKALESELINMLISDLEEKKKENLRDLSFGEGVIERFEEVTTRWEVQGEIDTTHLKRNLQMLGRDNYFQNESSPIYLSLSSTNFWKKLPDSLNKKIDQVYRIQLKRVGISFDKLTEYGTYCKLNFLAPNDLIDLNRDTEIILQKVEPIKEEYIQNSKLFISAGNSLKGRLEGSAKEIEELIQSLKHYNKIK